MRRTAVTLAIVLAGAIPAAASTMVHPGMAPSTRVRTGPAITYDAPFVNRVRPSVTSMTQDQKNRLIRAILLLKAAPSPWDPRFSWYDNFVWWHRKALACQVDQAHMRPAFLPWHRQYLFMFENALREVSHDDSVSVPFWDWTDPAARAAIFSPSFMGPNGDRQQDHAVLRGPFRKSRWVLNVRDAKQGDPLQYTFLSRNIGSWPGIRTLPTVAHVNAAMAMPYYDVAPYDVTSDVSTSFRNHIEGWRGFSGMRCSKGIMEPVKRTNRTQTERLHNAVHLWVGGAAGPTDDDSGGTMTLSTAPNDPVFWLHHANIDRLWSIWGARQAQGNAYAPLVATTGMRGQAIDEVMWPWRQSGYFVSPRSVLDHTRMGYDYEDAPVAKGAG